FRNYGFMDPEQFPEPLLRCSARFAHERTRRFVGEMSGAECDGTPIFNATQYLPGDYLLPHNDVGGPRTVSFIWSLSKGWQAHWGGHLFWCSPPTSISPTFNTLVIYPVSPNSYHLVSPVSPRAEGKRLAISGWWTARRDLPANPPPPAPWYRGALHDEGS